MRREDLKTMGLTDDQIESVMMAYGKELNPLKEQINSLTSERDSLKQQVVDRDGQLDDLRKNAGENDDLKATISSFKTTIRQLKLSIKMILRLKKKASRLKVLCETRRLRTLKLSFLCLILNKSVLVKTVHLTA